MDVNGEDGTVTVSGNADLNATNERLTGSIENVVVNVGATNTNSVGLEDLTPYSFTDTLNEAAFADGQIAYSLAFTSQVAQGSTVHVDLSYVYWA